MILREEAPEGAGALQHQDPIGKGSLRTSCCYPDFPLTPSLIDMHSHPIVDCRDLTGQDDSSSGSGSRRIISSGREPQMAVKCDGQAERTPRAPSLSALSDPSAIPLRDVRRSSPWVDSASRLVHGRLSGVVNPSPPRLAPPVAQRTPYSNRRRQSQIASMDDG